MWVVVHECGVHATIAGCRARPACTDAALPPPRHGRRRRARRRVERRDRARDRRARARVRVGGGVARAPAPPVEQLRDRAALRARERGRAWSSARLDRRRGVVTGHARNRRRSRRRQARGDQRRSRGWRAVLGIGVVADGARSHRSSASPRSAGIGFTVSLFVSELAFRQRARRRRREDRHPRGIGHRRRDLGVAMILRAITRDAKPGPPKRARSSTRIVA